MSEFFRRAWELETARFQLAIEYWYIWLAIIILGAFLSFLKIKSRGR
jgi:hypothetical protein